MKRLHNVIEVMGIHAGLVVCGQTEQALSNIGGLHASITAPFTAHESIGGRGNALKECLYWPTLCPISKQQPGLLLGDRTQRRPIEALLQRIAPATDRLMRGKWRRYRSVQAADVAQCLLGLAANNEPGVYTHHFDDIMEALHEAPP